MSNFDYNNTNIFSNNVNNKLYNILCLLTKTLLGVFRSDRNGSRSFCVPIDYIKRTIKFVQMDTWLHFCYSNIMSHSYFRIVWFVVLWGSWTFSMRVSLIVLTSVIEYSWPLCIPFRSLLFDASHVIRLLCSNACTRIRKSSESSGCPGVLVVDCVLS